MKRQEYERRILRYISEEFTILTAELKHASNKTNNEENEVH